MDNHDEIKVEETNITVTSEEVVSEEPSAVEVVDKTNIENVDESPKKRGRRKTYEEVPDTKDKFVRIFSKIATYCDGTLISGDNGLVFKVLEEKDRTVIIDTLRGPKEINKSYIKYVE